MCAVSWFSNNVSLARGSAQKIVSVLTEGVHVLTDLACVLQRTNFSHCSLTIGDSNVVGRLAIVALTDLPSFICLWLRQRVTSDSGYSAQRPSRLQN